MILKTFSYFCIDLKVPARDRAGIKVLAVI